MSTLAVIVSFTPMFFITGMMGPYMAPMAANVPITVSFSTMCALTIVPWLSYHMLKRLGTGARKGPGNQERKGPPQWIIIGYRMITGPFLEHRVMRLILLVVVLFLLAGSAALALFRHVPLKMLPFDNKNEFQIVLDMPDGSPLEATDRVLRHFEAYLRKVPEVTSFVTYAGTASPMDFNGMVRHYYLREGENLGDIRVNLADKKIREYQSHEILLRIRKDLERIARDQGASMKIVEVPPGPPVLSTLVAEVYGNPYMTYGDLIKGALHVGEVMKEEPFVVDIDDTTETNRERLDFVLDKEKAALHGISSQMVTQTLRMEMSCDHATVHARGERQCLPVKIGFRRENRTGTAALSLKEAILQAGAVRFRPIVLTAFTTAMGAWPITLDPVFSGLAWALIFGLFASTLFTLIIVPVTYFALNGMRAPATPPGG